MSNTKYYLSTALQFLLLSTISFSQDYFPLEIGNRWDYRSITYWHGGGHSLIYYSVVISDTTTINNEKYFILNYPSSGFQRYLKMENDTLFELTGDSVKCLDFIFNQELNTFYYTSCYNDSFIFYNKSTEPYFSEPDTQESHKNFPNEFYHYKFSIKFGIVYYSFSFGGAVYGDEYLLGCIIDGVVYGDTNVISVEDEVPSIPIEFSLSQNYPNPFNPSTKIKFTIPTSPLSFGEGQGVRLIVYDILGNEILTLVNEEKPAGTYEVEFDASNLPSGIYFYQLKAGSYLETRKMVLLK